MARPPYSPDLSATITSSSISTTFCRENISTTSRKWFPRAHRILKHRFLCFGNKPTYFLLAKNVLIVTVPILINKDVFEPSYNDLKLMVQNYNYICTDLIRSYKSWPHLHLTISNNLCVTASTQRESTTRLKCVPDRDYNT